MSAVPDDSATPSPVVCLLGPTASGKTAAALALAADAPVEIISLDSALVYREMDIGTAKPTPAELAAAPHHLIDQNPAGFGVRAKARRQLDRFAKKVAMFLDGLAGA